MRTLADVLGLSEEERARFAGVATGRATRAVSPVGSGVERGRGDADPSLVGRAPELALLGRLLGGEGPPVLLLAGEPGIGKSRLLHDATRRASPLGWQVVPGGCQRREGQAPYTPLLEAVERHLARQTTAQQRVALQGCAWLVRLLPELASGPIEPLPAWTLAPAQERRLLFRAVRRFLANVAGPAGTLLALDDLQWASADACELLSTLVQAAPEAAAPLRVVAAYRDTEVAAGTPLAHLLADLARAGLARHRTIAPLTDDEIRRVLAAGSSSLAGAEAALSERVVQRAGGVPFVALSCAEALRGSDAPDVDAVPWDVTQSVRQRVAALPADAQEVLHAAAVIGRAVQPALLATVTGRPPTAVGAALDAAGGARLLTDGARGYRFAHDIIREVLEADVGPAGRATLHRRAAEALEQATDEPPIEALADHYSRSDAPERALPYLEHAGDRAEAQFAHTAAQGYYRDAVARLEESGRTREAAWVREKLAEPLVMAGRYDAALAALEPAVSVYDATGDHDSVARITARIGSVHGLRKTAREGLARVQPLLAQAHAPSPGVVALHEALVELLFVSGRFDEMLRAAERAVDLAGTVGNARLLINVTEQRSRALAQIGRSEEALRGYRDACALAQAGGGSGRGSRVLPRSLGNLAYLQFLCGAFEAAAASNQQALAHAERIGDLDVVAHQTVMRASYAFFRGAWTQARADGERSLALRREMDAPSLVAGALNVLGHVADAEGHWDEAVGYLTAAVVAAEECADRPMLRATHWILAERDLREGRPADAQARLTPLLDRPGMEELEVTLFLPTLAQAYLEMGQVARATAVVQQAIHRTRGQELRFILVDALRIQALIAIRQGHGPEAQTALDEALALAHAMPYPQGEARVLAVYGAMHLRQGERAQARVRLEAALEILRRLGAHAESDHLRQIVATMDADREGGRTTPVGGA